MLPIVLDEHRVRVGLAGRGEALERRRAWLRELGAEPASVALSGASSLAGLRLLFIAGAGFEEAKVLAQAARNNHILVHVEDEIALCDFHVPALVKRGDLLVSVSTGGKAPGLAKLLRDWLSAKLDGEWASHVSEAGRARASWRSQGLPGAEVSRRTRLLGEGWLA